MTLKTSLFRVTPPHEEHTQYSQEFFKLKTQNRPTIKDHVKRKQSTDIISGRQIDTLTTSIVRDLQGLFKEYPLKDSIDKTIEIFASPPVSDMSSVIMYEKRTRTLQNFVKSLILTSGQYWGSSLTYSLQLQTKDVISNHQPGDVIYSGQTFLASFHQVESGNTYLDIHATSLVDVLFDYNVSTRNTIHEKLQPLLPSDVIDKVHYDTYRGTNLAISYNLVKDERVYVKFLGPRNLNIERIIYDNFKVLAGIYSDKEFMGAIVETNRELNYIEIIDRYQKASIVIR